MENECELRVYENNYLSVKETGNFFVFIWILELNFIKKGA
jgi:hypothetical protein